MSRAALRFKITKDDTNLSNEFQDHLSFKTAQKAKICIRYMLLNCEILIRKSGNLVKRFRLKLVF